MIFYDFEVFKYDWLVVVADTKKKEIFPIINSPDKLKAFYDKNVGDIWVGYNSRHYDQWILKCILCGLNPKELNDWIIVDRQEPWEFSSMMRKIPLNNYDTMPNPPVGLKTLEGFMGSNIKETDVPFNINRKLTKKEIEQTVFYCRHDVEETIKVFIERKSEFDALFGIVKAFNLPLSSIGDTEARITAKVLECEKTPFNDEFDYFFLPCIKLKKYRYVMDWFKDAVENADYELKHLKPDKREITKKYIECGGFDPENYWAKKYFYSRSLETDVAGIPHVFGFGGLHGAISKPVHLTGQILHVDVGSYYPSMLIAWNLITRAARRPDQYKHVYDTRMALKHAGKKREQAPYKKLLNALSGAMKDPTNRAYDPRNNNCMCINGQLMLLDLIEKLEAVPGFQLIQSNTDGLIIKIPDTDEAFNQVDDICFDWEQRCSTSKCSILLGLDTISEIYQKDVNNYLWIDAKGGVERKGAYVKELSAIDNDLPILNRALVEYMVHKTPIEQTINSCNELKEFQKLVKLSDKYKWVEHEHGTPKLLKETRHRNGTVTKLYQYPETERYSYKSYRVFASKNINNGRILKCKGGTHKPEKFGGTPDHSFIWNDSTDGVKCPDDLDRDWYIEAAKTRLNYFGVIT